VKLGTRQGYPLSSLQLNTVLKFLARETRQEKKNKRDYTWKQKAKLFLFIRHKSKFKDTKDSTKNLLYLKNTFRNIVGHKTNIQKFFVHQH
jgi:hypothetical protein